MISLGCTVVRGFIVDDYNCLQDDDSVPQTLIPNEYHLVKHPGVLGLEFHDE